MKLKKLLIYVMIFVSLFNFIYPTIVSADGEAGDDDDHSNSPEVLQEETTYFQNAGVGGAILDGLIGILTYVQRLEVLLIGMALGMLTSAVAYGEGRTGVELETGEAVFITPGTILFNKINLTDVNIFNTSPSAGPAISRIRLAIQKWYYATFTLSAIILLLILVYIGIRMAISTVAEKRAVYQKMITNWFVSMVVLFMLHFIIRATLFVNSQLVDIFANAASESANTNAMFLTLAGRALNPMATISWASVIVLFCLVILTLMFLFIYIKRMLTICFLVVIAPLITVTYSIDKIADNKSQALDTWLKEFMFGVLIQPFHCLIYLIFVSTAISLTTTGTLSSIVLATMMMFFIMKAEGIVRKIFGFEKSSSLSGAIGAAAAVGTGVTAAKTLLKPPAKKPGAKGASSGASSGSGSGAGGSGGSDGSGGSGGADGSSGSGSGGGSGSKNLKGNRGTKTTKMPTAAALKKKKGISNAIAYSISKDKGFSLRHPIKSFTKKNWAKTANNIANPLRTLRRPTTHMASFGLMGGLTAGMMGQSFTMGAIGGAAIGKSVGGYVEQGYSKIEEHQDNRMLATAYNNLKESMYAGDPNADIHMADLTNDMLNDQDGLENMQKLQGESDNDWYNRTANTGESRDQWQDRMNYAQALYATQNRFQAAGNDREKSADKVMDTIRDIGAGKIKGYRTNIETKPPMGS